MAKADKEHLYSARNQCTTRANVTTNYHKFRKKGNASICHFVKSAVPQLPASALPLRAVAGI